MHSKHKIYASLVLQRTPVICPPLNVIEKTISRVLEKLENVKSVRSDHEMRHISDVERAKHISSKKALDESEIEASAQKTALELEDVWEKERTLFESLTTVAESDDKRSLNRCLNKNLVLVCNRTNSEQPFWGFPRSKHREGETLRQTIDRIVQSLNKSGSLDVRVMGNAPCAVLPHKCSKKLMKKYGETPYFTTFFFKAELIKGDVDLNSCDKEVMSDYMWLSRRECSDLLTKGYWGTVSSSLFMEELNPRTIDRVIRKLKERISENETKTRVRRCN